MPDIKYNEVAAKWWGEKIRNVKLKNYNNGDPSDVGAVAMILMTMLAVDKQASNDEVDLFELKLAQAIEKAVNDHDGYLNFGVDYGPDSILADTANECGISPTLFPWKTYMLIENGKVSVSNEYGLQYRQIFPK